MTLDYGTFGIFLTLGNAGFMSSTVPQWVSIPQPATEQSKML